MIRRLLTVLVIVVLGGWAASAAYSGAGGTSLSPSQTPAEAQASYESWLVAEAARQKRVEDERRYRAGEMGPAEAATFAALLAREAEAARRERERQAYLRNVQRSRSGGGSSSGK